MPGGKLKDVRNAVKDVFGENYLPQQLLDAKMLKDTYGVSEDMTKEFIAEVPLINVHIDTFVGIEAADGKTEEVKKALDDYRLKLIMDETQYPANRQMAKASTVHQVGNYVFFIMLNNGTDVAEEDENEQYEHYVTQNLKAVSAINKVLRGSSSDTSEGSSDSADTESGTSSNVSAEE